MPYSWRQEILHLNEIRGYRDSENWKCGSCGLKRRIVWQKPTNALEEQDASIFRNQSLKEVAPLSLETFITLY
jgi:hypothetical protein